VSEFSSADKKFKGWTKPGPVLDSVPELEDGETLDAISGTYRIYQYADGHRFSTDDILVAWFATTNAIRAERVLDLGSGIGSVAMTAAWRLPSRKARRKRWSLRIRSMRLDKLEVRAMATPACGFTNMFVRGRAANSKRIWA